MSKILTEEQFKVVNNIKELIENANSKTNDKKVEKWLEKLNEDFDLTDKEKQSITDILSTKKSSFTPDSSNGFLLKGFLLKLEEEDIKFPVKIKDEVVFNFVDKFNVDYVYKFITKLLEEHNKEEIKTKIKSLYFEDKKTITEISSILNIEEKKIQTLIKRIENSSIMRKANPKVKED